MKQVHVAAAVILREKDNVKEIFATQRGYGEYKDGWEFPGGKLEPGETCQEAIVREIREELDSCVGVEKLLGTVEYDYPGFHLVMDCLLCRLESGALTLLEHEAAKWLDGKNLMSVDWLPADQLILDEVKRVLE